MQENKDKKIKIIRKNIDLDEDSVKALSKQAIDSPFKNFKLYAEHILKTQAKKTK